MVKQNITISIDSETIKNARNKIKNISKTCENALKLKLEPNKKDVSDECLRLQCIYCKRIVDHGYICEITKQFRCEECEKAEINTEYSRTLKYPCIHKDHEHIKIPNIDGEIPERIKKEVLEHGTTKIN